MSADRSNTTPMMQRYLEVKRENPDALLLFRMGDFYELFYEDAEVAAKVLGLTLTSRDKGSANPIAMAGFPYHSLDGYLQKLIRAGFRTAICEQVEDPKQAKGLVKREVTQVVTPGTVTDDHLLDPRESNYVACLFPAKSTFGLAWLELSTGRFLTAAVEPRLLGDELARIRPAECLLPEEFDDHADCHQLLNGVMKTSRPPWSFGADDCRRRLLEHFGTSTLEGFDLDDHSPAVTAAGALLEYVQETQKAALGHITLLEPYRHGKYLIIDEATRRSLELTHTMRDGGRAGSLLDVIDETVSPMGARLLADWLANPLTDLAEIEERLDAVEELTSDLQLADDLRGQLKQTYDIGRLISRIATSRANPRDLSCLSRTLGLLPKLKAKLAGRQSQRLQTLETRLDLCAEVRGEIDRTLVDDPPVVVTEGGVIRTGFHADLDRLRDLARGGKEWIAKYQAEEIERTKIPSLKVGFNKVFGYYLEVTAAHLDKVPDDYIRKQTLKNQERFVTPQLKEHEEEVLRAEEQAVQLEQQLFADLRIHLVDAVPRLQTTANVLAEVDVLAALATLAVHRRYCRGELTTEPILDIRDGRHPVLDKLQPSGEFVPNDVLLGLNRKNEATSNTESADNAAPPATIQILTGPNMAGKSTYIRQAALITILAQIGSFVPASSARIGVADRVFARVGASDELGKGQSTFMVEMTETARILNAATKRSLVILDEIGRGTSTYDGISLAWAVTEYLHDVIGCRTLFATHYHELTELTATLSQAENWNVAVREQQDGITFLHRIVPGAANKSYGIHVAKLAGVPRTVIERAQTVLETLEADHIDESGRPKMPERSTRETNRRQLSLFGSQRHPLLDDLRELNLDEMTPLGALQELHRLREQLDSDA